LKDDNPDDPRRETTGSNTTSVSKRAANARIDVHVLLDGAVEFFYITKKITSFDSKTTHKISLYQTIGKKNQ